jgi:hypothetical protein
LCRVKGLPFLENITILVHKPNFQKLFMINSLLWVVVDSKCFDPIHHITDSLCQSANHNATDFILYDSLLVKLFLTCKYLTYKLLTWRSATISKTI